MTDLLKKSQLGLIQSKVFEYISAFDISIKILKEPNSMIS
jgi:hypothetical protein